MTSSIEPANGYCFPPTSSSVGTLAHIVMPVDQRPAWVRNYLEDVFNGHNLQSLDEYMTENLISHWLGDRNLNGREAVLRRLS